QNIKLIVTYFAVTLPKCAFVVQHCTVHYYLWRNILLTSFKIFFFKIKMSTQFFSKLSQNYIELLEDNEYYDITIEVGEDLDVKFFRAHMNILCYRSPYLRRE